jgi:hypothetical protein
MIVFIDNRYLADREVVTILLLKYKINSDDFNL